MASLLRVLCSGPGVGLPTRASCPEAAALLEAGAALALSSATACFNQQYTPTTAFALPLPAALALLSDLIEHAWATLSNETRFRCERVALVLAGAWPGGWQRAGSGSGGSSDGVISGGRPVTALAWGSEPSVHVEPNAADVAWGAHSLVGAAGRKRQRGEEGARATSGGGGATPAWGGGLWGAGDEWGPGDAWSAAEAPSAQQRLFASATLLPILPPSSAAAQQQQLTSSSAGEGGARSVGTARSSHEHAAAAASIAGVPLLSKAALSALSELLAVCALCPWGGGVLSPLSPVLRSALAGSAEGLGRGSSGSTGARALREGGGGSSSLSLVSAVLTSRLVVAALPVALPVAAEDDSPVLDVLTHVAVAVNGKVDGEVAALATTAGAAAATTAAVPPHVAAGAVATRSVFFAPLPPPPAAPPHTSSSLVTLPSGQMTEGMPAPAAAGIALPSIPSVALSAPPPISSGVTAAAEEGRLAAVAVEGAAAAPLAASVAVGGVGGAPLSTADAARLQRYADALVDFPELQ